MNHDFVRVGNTVLCAFLLVLTQVSCIPPSSDSQLMRSLTNASGRGVAIVVQQADCESRGSELRILATRLPDIPVVLLRTRGGPPSAWEETVRTIFPESRHGYHITRDGAALIKLGVSSTPAFLEWGETPGEARGTPLSLSWSQMLYQIREIEARYSSP